MATSLKNAFSTPVAATDTKIYTCPASTKTVISNINVCNTSAIATTFRVFVKSLGSTSYNLYYDVAINGNDSFNRVAGDVLIATDEIWVRATLATLDFAVSMQENT